MKHKSKEAELKLAVLSLWGLMIIMTGCGTKYFVQSEFDDAVNGYRSLLERSDYEAAGLFVAAPIAAEYLRSAKAAEGFRVVECRILKIDYDESRREAEVFVEIGYYSQLTLRAGAVRYTQKWVYAKVNGSSQWRLTTALPEFR